MMFNLVRPRPAAVVLGTLVAFLSVTAHAGIVPVTDDIHADSLGLFSPLNGALRRRQVDEWATTIACIYSGVLKLSFLSTPARVYRGVRETDLELPPHFLEVEEGFQRTNSMTQLFCPFPS